METRSKHHEEMEEVETIDEEPAHEFLSRWHRPWQFSDVVLVVEDTKFHVHKCILSMWSPVFEAMFTSQFKESSAKEIPLPGKLADEVEQMLEVIYSDDAKQEITEENYEFLLELAREYQMEKVQQYCAQYMGQGIDDENCLHRYSIADSFGLEDVMEKCNKEACFKSSTDLVESYDFFELGVESKVKLCMTRIRKLEKLLTKYAGICSKLVSGYYAKLDSYAGQVPKGVQCVKKISHQPVLSQNGNTVRKDFDSSCRYCRKRIGSYKSTISAVNAIEFDDLFIQLYALEHNTKVAAKIRENMNASQP